MSDLVDFMALRAECLKYPQYPLVTKLGNDIEKALLNAYRAL